MKKFALSLVAMLVFAVAAPAMAANPFVDVPQGHWAYDAINKLNQAGIVQGFADNTFKGKDPITRYEMAAIIERVIEKIPTTSAGTPNFDEAKFKAEQVELITKLAKEFKGELAGMGVKVDALTGRISTIEGKIEELEKTQANSILDKVSFSGSTKIKVETPEVTEAGDLRNEVSAYQKLGLNIKANIADGVALNAGLDTVKNFIDNNAVNEKALSVNNMNLNVNTGKVDATIGTLPEMSFGKLTLDKYSAEDDDYTTVADEELKNEGLKINTNIFKTDVTGLAAIEGANYIYGVNASRDVKNVKVTGSAVIVADHVIPTKTEEMSNKVFGIGAETKVGKYGTVKGEVAVNKLERDSMAVRVESEANLYKALKANVNIYNTGVNFNSAKGNNYNTDGETYALIGVGTGGDLEKAYVSLQDGAVDAKDVRFDALNGYKTKLGAKNDLELKGSLIWDSKISDLKDEFKNPALMAQATLSRPVFKNSVVSANYKLGSTNVKEFKDNIKTSELEAKMETGIAKNATMSVGFTAGNLGTDNDVTKKASAELKATF